MSGPRASKRAFLCELPCLPADTKVRFLGCVRQYNVTEGHLILEHNYLRGNEEANIVSVDINAVLEDVTSEELRVGAWLNVIGYVRDCHSPSGSFSSSQLDAQSQHSIESSSAKVPSTVPSRPVYIDAVLVYPAGAIALGEYERILRNLLDVERRMQFVG
ncbi:hypothetical protein N7509_002356 [Penicillium cosmopolitanum]|uniref:CST complex subunit Ten1 n=1 Tax=Penicillium cosmopolitanum TaxID=1131564 RepID=A0A9W9W919_9EURO|nr:uncharacterized protein N7509_002356 [Penicillium cosmopolitanum]KAJ5408473.1 hypothetical protein N7509_002356 [Penicillium cosmopolitanum]